MTMQTRSIGEGEGWRASRFICTAGPEDHAFEERHDGVSVSFVARGGFEYRTRTGSASLVAGAILLGNAGQCFECGHRHGSGDECISFQFSPACWEEIVAALPGVRQAGFARPSHPPDWALSPLLAMAEAASEIAAPMAVEELAFRVAGAIIRRTGGIETQASSIGARDRGRIVEAALRMAREAETLDAVPLGLAALAREAGMSRYHFLRQFRAVIGMTPHQYLLRFRMQQAGRRLLTSGDAISTIAFDAGFGDLSTFNRQFRRAMGASPGEFRRDRGAHAVPALPASLIPASEKRARISE